MSHTSAGHRKAQQFLDSLDNRSVVMDGDGRAYQHGGMYAPYWYPAWNNAEPLSSYELAFRYPIRLMKEIS